MKRNSIHFCQFSYDGLLPYQYVQMKSEGNSIYQNNSCNKFRGVFLINQTLFQKWLVNCINENYFQLWLKIKINNECKSLEVQK